MHTKRKKICEVLVSTAIVTVVPVTLAWTFATLRNWHSLKFGSLVIALIYGILMGVLTMGIYIIPSAFLVSLLIVYLKRWSLRAVVLIFFAVVVCSSICSFLLDPTQSREQHGSVGYFMRGDWFLSQLNLIGIVTSFAAALIAFWVVQRCRRRSEIAPVT